MVIASAIALMVLMVATIGLLTGPERGRWPEGFACALVACVVVVPMCMMFDAT